MYWQCSCSAVRSWTFFDISCIVSLNEYIWSLKFLLVLDILNIIYSNMLLFLSLIQNCITESNSLLWFLPRKVYFQFSLNTFTTIEYYINPKNSFLISQKNNFTYCDSFGSRRDPSLDDGSRWELKLSQWFFFLGHYFLWQFRFPSRIIIKWWFSVGTETDTVNEKCSWDIK